jgi:hypothetical protein
MIHNGLIKENKLDDWVRGNAHVALGVIVELVYRLVAAAAPNPKERRFPLGDSIGQPGPDGVLDTNFGFDRFVPEGSSYWEIGTDTEAENKATDDYSNLVNTIPPEVRAESTFIFVTPLSGRRPRPHAWKKSAQAKWLAERRERKDWKDVRVIDGTDLTDWLKIFPAVENWFVDKIGHGNNNYGWLRDISYFFADLFGDFKLLFSRVNREHRATEWKNHLKSYAWKKVGIENTEIAKIDFLADHLGVLDAKFNGYLTFLAVLGAVATIDGIKSIAKIYECLHYPNILLVSSSVCLPLLCFSILHLLSRFLDPKLYKVPVIPFDYYMWILFVLVVISIFIRISFYFPALFFFGWLIFSIFLCFAGSQMLYWGGMKVDDAIGKHLEGMIRAVLYRTMLYRLAWISICITIILFFGFIFSYNQSK